MDGHSAGTAQIFQTPGQVKQGALVKYAVEYISVYQII